MFNKKLLLSTLLSFCVIFSVFSVNCTVNAVEAYSGSGTLADPYLVTNAQQLQGMRDNLTANYRLANTIDMSGVEFKPIGRFDSAFKGSFTCELNSDNTPKYVIKNLNVSVAATQYVAQNKNKWEAAMFGKTEAATISGIYILDAKISNDNIGGNTGSIKYNDYNPGMGEMPTAVLVGKAENTTITNCAATGTLNAKSNGCGGLIGIAVGSTIENSYSAVSVTTSGLWTMGGFAGSLEGCTVNYCFSTGDLTANGYTVGGGFVSTADKSTISDCYSTGNVNGGCGAFIKPTQNSATGTFINCFTIGSAQSQSGDLTIFTIAPKNCWVVSGKVTNTPFTLGSMADIKNAFNGLANWSTSGEYPTLTTVGIISDASSYQPESGSQTTTGATTAQSGQSGQTVSQSASTVQVSGSKEIEDMIKALPDPEVDKAVTLGCKEDCKKAVAAYEALSASEKDDFDQALVAKLSKVKYQISLLMAGDIVTRIEKLPEIKKLSSEDVEEILSIWDDYNFLDDNVKSEIDSKYLDKLNAAYEFAKGNNSQTGTVETVENGLNGIEIAISVICIVIIALAVGFDVFAGIWFIKKRKILNFEKALVRDDNGAK